jgi:uncharacterized protein (TIGR00369 family)
VALRASVDLASFNARGAGHLPGLLGIRVTEVSEGLVRVEFTVRQELMAPNGYLHAGSVVSLADTAAGYATIAHLPEGAEGFTTMELKSNLLGTARSGVVRAEARAVHLGRSTQVWDATCMAEGAERPIALFRCTQMVLWPKA